MNQNETTTVRLINPFDIPQEELKSFRLNQSDIMAITKENIMFLSQVKNMAVFLQNKEGDGNSYSRFLSDSNHRKLLDDRIVELSEELVNMNLHIIKNFKRSKK